MKNIREKEQIHSIKPRGWPWYVSVGNIKTCLTDTNIMILSLIL